ncbi:MAG: mechanosensitive ion channel [bacterium]
MKGWKSKIDLLPFLFQMRAQKLFIPLFFLLLFFAHPKTSFTLWAQAPESKNSAASQPASKPAEPVISLESPEDAKFREKYKDRLSSLQDDLSRLKSQFDEGQKELTAEAEKAVNFLQIEEISPDEFKPYLDKWRLMRDSYADVLEDINGQIDEVNQIRVSLESKLRLWQLKEGDLKLLRDQAPKGKADPEVMEKLSQIRTILKSYESEKEQAEALFSDLSKFKPQLAASLENCRKIFHLLAQRWKTVQFSYLKIRQQPKFSGETLKLAAQELNYRLRDWRTYTEGAKDYFKDLFSLLAEKPLKGLLTAGLLIAAGFGLLHWKRRVKTTIEKPEEHTLFERFGRQFFRLFTSRLVPFLLLFAFGLTLLNFTEARTPVGLFLFYSLTGVYLVWLLSRSLKILLVDHGEQTNLLSVSPTAGKSLHRRFLLLLVLIYLFILLGLATSFLGYNTEASRLFKWLLEILIFGLLISISSSKWAGQILPDNAPHFRKVLRNTLRVALFILLAVTIGVDLMGYTNLSDYLAESALKSIAVFPLILFLKKGLIELIDYKLFARTLTQLRVQEDLRIKWKKTLRQWVSLGLWVVLILWVSSIWRLTYNLRDLIQKALSQGFSIGSVHITVGLIFSVILTFYLSILLSRFIRALLERDVYPRYGWDPGIRNAVSTGIHYCIILCGLVIALKLLGFDIRNVTVLAGAFGVGLGFGLQNLANNFASGIVLLIERPVKVGDVIQIGNISGKVRKIGARSTVIETGDKASILIPNGELLSGQVTNWTYSNAIAGISVPVGVAYGSDVEKVKELLLQTAQSHKKIVKEPKPNVEFKGFGESSVDFVLKAWVADVDDRTNVQTDLFFAIEKIFRENKIEIPYPHREVIFRQEEKTEA